MMMTTLEQTLKQSGMRMTPQRAAICRLLENTDTHPTAAQIYTALKPHFPYLSLATVYNTLDALVRLGAVNALGSAGDDTVHYDADTGPHVNLACISCHQVIDLESSHVSALEQEVARSSGYRLLGARILYYGLCATCSAKESTTLSQMGEIGK
jgi:Fur family peroxide stress response transcriptional regulator